MFKNTNNSPTDVAITMKTKIKGNKYCLGNGM